MKLYSFKFAFFLVALLAALPLSAGAQEAQDHEARDPETTIRSRSNLVRVPTLVEDARGNVVYGLKVEDFEIEDDGAGQKLSLDETPDAEPVSIMVAVQVGRRADREFPRIRGLAAMFDAVLTAPNTEAALLLFDTRLNLVRDFTNDAGQIEDDMKHLEHGDSGAAIYDAVAYSAKLLNKREEGRQRVLLLISETRDHGSHFSNLDDVVGLIGSTNTTVYALPFSPYASEQLDVFRGTGDLTSGMDILEKLVAARNALKKNAPKALTSMTGGEYELFTSQKSFEKDMIDFSNHLHARYLLSFVPKDPHPGLHEIRVHLKAESGNRTLVYRKTYWVDDADR